jgi:hypothetical protein
MIKLRTEVTELRNLMEKRSGVKDLKFPGDCDQRTLLRAAEADGTVKHGGNHDTVIDPTTGAVITQLPRHDPKSGTCRAIIKSLKKALSHED